MRIAKAAAEVVEDKGLAGLTHRAVAARAGVTTGSVTHHFRSVEDLVAGAIRGQVQAMTDEAAAQADAPSSIEAILTPDAWIAALRPHVISELPSSPLSAADASSWRRSATGIGWPPASSSDFRTAAHCVTAWAGCSRPGRRSAAYASVLARLLSAIWFACAGDEDPVAGRAALFERVAAGVLGRPIAGAAA
ncbi:TetR/AcrR family transcriptional regulator [Caulobacter segnis]